MGQKKQNEINIPRGIMIRKHKAGSTINISFTYKGLRCREPLSNLEVNSKNIKYAERLLATVLNVKIMEKRDGTTHSILRSF